MTKIPPRLKANARALRRNMTDAERALWSLLRTYRPRFNHQFAAAGFVLDFACRKARVAIELDGGQHDDNAKDVRRTEALEARAGKCFGSGTTTCCRTGTGYWK